MQRAAAATNSCGGRRLELAFEVANEDDDIEIKAEEVLVDVETGQRSICLEWQHVSLRFLKGSSQQRHKGKMISSSSSTDQPSPKTLNPYTLDNVYGQVPYGQVTAIMGASGSGKTTLLNVLSGRMVHTRHHLSVQYDIRWNNTTADPLTYRKSIAFCSQEDSLHTTATPYEAIRFSAKLRLPRETTTADLERRTNAMLEQLSLLDCAHTMIGGPLVKGISGGERKRTSVGVELITEPSLIFLDEPTSGLDAHNALELCQVLHKMCRDSSTAVVLTIHQPGSSIFNTTLDRLVLLNKGRVMYEGEVSNVPAYFASRGHPVPLNFNTADHVVTVAQMVPMKKLENSGFFELPSRDLSQHGNIRSTELCQKPQPTNVTAINASFATQVNLQLAREFQHLRRNRHAIVSRTIMTLFISTLAGILFYDVGSKGYGDFVNAQTTFGGLFICIVANVFATVLPSLIMFPQERPVFMREYATNHYSAPSYFLSRLVLELLVTAVQVSVSVGITYNAMNLQSDFGLFWCAIYIAALTSTAIGVFIGCATKDAGVAIEFLPIVFTPQMLFSGFFIPQELMPIWLGWVSYLFPFSYAIRILALLEFRGERCEGSPICGLILSNIHVDADDEWWYWLMLVVELILFRVMALLVLRHKAQSFY